MPLPDFLVAGAMKAGTSTLRAMLNQHPAVHMSKRKELHYFDTHYDRGTQWYESRFRPSDGELVCGEATPIYMTDDILRQRMHETVPGARLLIILREPIARAHSHFWMLRSRGTELLPSFEEAIAAEDQRWAERGGIRAKWRFAYKRRGHYAEQLRGLQDLYGRERLHVVVLEELVKRPQDVMRGVYTFIGVDPSFADSVQLEHRLQTRTPLEKNGRRYPEMLENTREHLRDYFAPRNMDLEDWLGRSVTCWAP